MLCTCGGALARHWQTFHCGWPLSARFPEDELMDWKVFDQAAISSTTDFEFGNNSIASW